MTAAEWIVPGSLGVMAGYAFRQHLAEWLARRRYRCEVCGARTDDDGIGAGEVDDVE